MIMETARLVYQCRCVFVKDQKLEQGSETLDGDEALEALQWWTKKKQMTRRRRTRGFNDIPFLQ
ncbi:hypothetical protein F2Q68_00032342 [Brassica cretica]|uniref:Uncharacterized protein n=1 Tax=Brassica cretica TaxID=69181 RepID=A0A8S9GCS6_BRACR|nr:hypothetical protein F2Q68_00032342 [Brassica cretica]